MRILRRLALLVPLATVALASSASASVAVLADPNNLLIAGDGGSNVVAVDPLTVLPGKQLRVVDVSSPLSLAGGCTFEPGVTNRADCVPVMRIAALLAGGDDALTVDAFLPVEAYGQTGGDTITGGAVDDVLEGNGGNDVLQGDAGNDRISDGNRTDPDAGNGGNDRLSGGAGNDYLDGGPLPGGGAGADILDGEAGSDTVDYSTRTAAVSVTEAGGADDGEAGEGDNVVNGETILGGSAADTLTGAGEPNALRGARGDDTLDGGGSADVLDGGPGNDTVSYAPRMVPVAATLDGEPGDGAAGENDAIGPDVENLRGGYESDALTGSTGPNALAGGPGNDTLEALGGDDSLAGDGGDDTLNGASGDDTLAGGDGNDKIVAGTGSDTITCGDGDDTVVADANDSVAADCEHVSLQGATGPGGNEGGTGQGGTPVDSAGPSLVLPARLKRGRRHTVSARVACPTAETTGCLSVQLTVMAKGKRIGKATVKVIRGGGSKTLKLRLKGTKLPKRVKLVATAADATGNRATSRRNARVR